MAAHGAGNGEGIIQLQRTAAVVTGAQTVPQQRFALHACATRSHLSLASVRKARQLAICATNASSTA